MGNPEYEQSSIKKMKQPGVDISGKDSSVLSEAIGVHNESAPSLVDGDVKQLQLDDLANLKMTLGDPAQILDLKMAYAFPLPIGWKRQFDYGTRDDGQAEFVGLALMATDEGTAEWYIFKYTFSNSDVTKEESAYGSWTGRSALFS